MIINWGVCISQCVHAEAMRRIRALSAYASIDSGATLNTQHGHVHGMRAGHLSSTRSRMQTEINSGTWLFNPCMDVLKSASMCVNECGVALLFLSARH
jgi:hypothetical protein